MNIFKRFKNVSIEEVTSERKPRTDKVVDFGKVYKEIENERVHKEILDEQKKDLAYRAKLLSDKLKLEDIVDVKRMDISTISRIYSDLVAIDNVVETEKKIDTEIKSRIKVKAIKK